MTAYAGGDDRAGDALVRCLGPRVYRFFLRKFGDPAIADDLMQITFLKIHRARGDFRVGAPVRPWVFTIAARVRLDELRRRGRHAWSGGDDVVERASRGAAIARASEPHEAERRETAAAVRAAIRKLPDTQRVVVQLHRYEGLTFAEIARTIGSTEGAVKLRAFRAYELLRRELAPLLRPEGDR